MNERRLILDVNVIVSAALWRQSIPRRVFDLSESHILLISPSVTRELREVLERPKFDKYAALEERMRVFQNVIDRAIGIEDVEPIAVCRDPKDDKYLELAVSGQAHCIVTGDADLLALHPFRGIAILTPKDFLDWIAAESPSA